MKTRILCSILCISTLAFSACSRKTTPSASTGGGNVNAQVVYADNNKNNSNPVNPLITDPSAPVPPGNEKVLIILDKGGRLTYTNKNVPSYVLAANKSLPANQPVSATHRSNMLARHKTLPPQALYVPDAIASKSSKGQYYKYQSKFWYWKKGNGFYYLDETYYQ